MEQSTNSPFHFTSATSRAPRSCLDGFFPERPLCPEEKLARGKARIADLASEYDALEQDLIDRKELDRQQRWQRFLLLYELACLVLYFADQRLLALMACDTPEGCLAELWPGRKLCLAQFQKYLQVARLIPEPVVRLCKAGIELLWRISKVEGPRTLEMLCALLQSGTGARHVRRAADAAIAAMESGLPDEEALLLAREALDEKRARRAALGPVTGEEYERLLHKLEETHQVVHRMQEEQRVTHNLLEQFVAAVSQSGMLGIQPNPAAAPAPALDERQTNRGRGAGPAARANAAVNTATPPVNTASNKAESPPPITTQPSASPPPAPPASPQNAEKALLTPEKALSQEPTTAAPAAQSTEKALSQELATAAPAAPVPQSTEKALSQEPMTAAPVPQSTEKALSQEPAATPPPPPEPARPAESTHTTAADSSRPSGPQSADERRRYIEKLCAPYTPQKPPARNLVVPLLSGWNEDPGFVVRDPYILGTRHRSPQIATIGRSSKYRYRIGINLNDPLAMSAFSVPSGGKSYLLCQIIQNCVRSNHYINVLPRPLCCIYPYFSDSDFADPPILAAIRENHDPREVLSLMEDYGVLPESFAGHYVLLCDVDRVEEMRRRYPYIEVYPSVCASSELSPDQFLILLGANDKNEDSLYLRRIRQVISQMGPRITLDGLEARLRQEGFDPGIWGLIQARLNLMRDRICDAYPLHKRAQRGRILVLDTRETVVSRNDAMALLALMTSVLIRREAGSSILTPDGTPAGDEGCDFLIAVDEVQKFLANKIFVAQLEYLIRERRHLRVRVLLTTQDPPSMPTRLLSLSNVIFIGRMNAEEWVKVLPRANGIFKGLKSAHLRNFRDGQMIIWAEEVFCEGLLPEMAPPINLMDVRAQLGHHGGATLRAVR